MAGRPKVAVVGAGPLGLMALKNFLDDGFDVTLYESRSWVGGVWKYSTDSTLSAGENTVFNSSKLRSSISDFPVPDDMDTFPTAPQLQKYLESYCDHFDLWPHIRLDSPVASVKRVGEQWAIEVGSEGESNETYMFTHCALSCGPYNNPRYPTFEGIEEFQGRNFHSLYYHDPSQFKGQNVLLIGAHATAQDIVDQLARHSKHAYLSHRSGVVMMPRYNADGSTYDSQPPLNVTLILTYLSVWFPRLFNWMIDQVCVAASKKAFPNPPASLGSILTTKPHSVAVTPPLIASAIYPHFESGFAEGVPEVKRIVGPKSVELKDGRVLEDIDTIIYCTGYTSAIPVKLEPEELNPYPYPGALPNLYRNTFSLHPDPTIRNSIAYLGQAAVPSPGFAPHEAIAIAVSQIWRGKSQLPSLPEMQKWTRGFQKWRETTTKQYNAQSTFYTVFVPIADHLDWLDKTAGLGIRSHFGLMNRWINPEAWSFWWKDRKFYHLCLNGFLSPAVWRLFDVGKRKAWKGAAAQIEIDNEKAKKQARERLQALAKGVEK